MHSFSSPSTGQFRRAQNRRASKGNTLSTKTTTTRPPDIRAVRRRVSLSDRIALRIGMSLIIWSRRTHHVRPSVDIATRNRLERERQQREAEWLLRSAALHLWH